MIRWMSKKKVLKAARGNRTPKKAKKGKQLKECTFTFNSITCFIVVNFTLQGGEEQKCAHFKPFEADWCSESSPRRGSAESQQQHFQYNSDQLLIKWSAHQTFNA